MIRDKISTRTRLDFSIMPDSSTIPDAHLKKRFGTTAATANITSGELRVISGTVNNFTGGVLYALRGGQIADNFELYARMRFVSSGANSTWFPALTIRGSTDANGVVPNRALRVSFGPAGYNIGRSITGVSTGVSGAGASFSSAVATGAVFHLRLRANGDQLLMRGWKDGETEPPSWPCRGLDNTIPRKGEIGILVQGGSATNATLAIQELLIQQIEPLDTGAPTNGNLAFRYSATATLLPGVGGNVVRADATTAPFTLTLPSADTVAHKPITIKKIDAGTNAVTLAAAGSDTIDGATTYVLSTVRGVVRLLSSGTGGFDVI